MKPPTREMFERNPESFCDNALLWFKVLKESRERLESTIAERDRRIKMLEQALEDWMP